MSVTCDPYGCCTLNGVLVVCGPQSGHVLTVGWRGGGAKEGGGGEKGGCRLTAAWVRYQSGRNLISFLVVCTIPVRFLILSVFLLCFLFPSFLKLYHTSLYSDFRVYLSDLHKCP